MKFVSFTLYDNTIIELDINFIIYLKNINKKNGANYNSIIGLKGNDKEICVIETVDQIKNIINKSKHEIEFNNKMDNILK